MLLTAAIFIAIWFINIGLMYWVDNHMLYKRHVKLFRETLQEELRKIQAEKLASPGGKVEKS